MILIYKHLSWCLKKTLKKYLRGRPSCSWLPHGLMAKISPLTMAARIRIPLREHRPNHLAMQRTLMNNYYETLMLLLRIHLFLRPSAFKSP